MKKFLPLLVVFTGCSLFKSTVCNVEEKVVAQLSTTLSAALACAHPDLVEKDVKSALSKVTFCGDASAQKAVGVCSIASSLVTNMVFAAAIPSSWGCTGSAPKDAIEKILESACSRVIN